MMKSIKVLSPEVEFSGNLSPRRVLKFPGASTKKNKKTKKIYIIVIIVHACCGFLLDFHVQTAIPHVSSWRRFKIGHTHTHVTLERWQHFREDKHWVRMLCFVFVDEDVEASA